MLRYVDRMAYRTKMLATYVQAISIILSAAVPFVLVTFSLVNLAVILSSGVTILVALQLFLNLGSQWEQYRLYRTELRKLIFELDLAATNPDQARAILNAVSGKILELIQLQESPWFTAEQVAFDTKIGAIGARRSSAR
jgi:hypothetical protein